MLIPFNLRNEKERVEAVLARVEGVDKRLDKINDEIPATTIRHGWLASLDQHNRPDSGESTLRQVRQEHADAYAGHLLKKVSATTFNRHVRLLALVPRKPTLTRAVTRCASAD
ncbi:MAG: hypothetical protein WCK89_03310 [bacterium]